MNVRIRRNLTAPAAVAVSTLLVLAWWATPTAPASAAAEGAQDATLSPAMNASSPPFSFHHLRPHEQDLYSLYPLLFEKKKNI
ncbi:hypothetical protein, partial [Stenotrophomonas maltophilia]